MDDTDSSLCLFTSGLSSQVSDHSSTITSKPSGAHNPLNSQCLYPAACHIRSICQEHRNGTEKEFSQYWATLGLEGQRAALLKATSGPEEKGIDHDPPLRKVPRFRHRVPSNTSTPISTVHPYIPAKFVQHRDYAWGMGINPLTSSSPPLESPPLPAMSSNIIVIGGSRNIGYFSALRFLAKGSTVTFLLRTPSVFDKDTAIQEYVKSGKAYLVKGDCQVEADVQRVWDEAGSKGPVDLLLFTLRITGTYPNFTLTKGFVQNPVGLVTQSFFNVLCTFPINQSPQPKVITLSSIGLSRTSHDSLPLALKPIYAWLLAAPHKDKLGMEVLAAHAAGWSWDSKSDGEPGDDVMRGEPWGTAWKTRKGLPAEGTIKRILVIRPALLTDGDCKADKAGRKGEPYRVSEKELGGYTVSRKDVAHFITQAVTEKWDQYEGKQVNIGY
ncbi:hypothetical protein BDN71DRAFT_1502269 [Pleurotus eryngii]|uniref:NAD(P)-binding domain-containing protein n=1 Tax=Pleurotus eryngii TaxID=5323 RepID=A0A9P6DK29_PLEER|nr:hypothetical protein BDN71DRAFT_1502269 [Pleurotus eryngii]